MSVPLSYPLELTRKTPRSVADVSLRHAAIAAGLGVFWTPQSGDSSTPGAARSLHGVLTDLALPQTQKCRRTSASTATSAWRAAPLPLWILKDKRISENVSRFSTALWPCKDHQVLDEWAGKTPDEQIKMLFTKDFFMTYQASFIGFQYACFKCYSSCPVGSKVGKKEADNVKEILSKDVKDHGQLGLVN